MKGKLIFAGDTSKDIAQDVESRWIDNQQTGQVVVKEISVHCLQ